MGHGRANSAAAQACQHKRLRAKRVALRVETREPRPGAPLAPLTFDRSTGSYEFGRIEAKLVYKNANRARALHFSILCVLRIAIS